MDDPAGFLLAALALAGSPGPATLSLAAAGAGFGARHAFPYMAGIIVGMIAVMGATASGVAGLLLVLPGVAPVAAVLAAGYFVWLAVRIATAAPPAATEGVARRPGSADGVMLSLINPKGYVAMASLFSGFTLVPGHAAADAMVKTLLLTAVITIVNTVWLLAGTTLTRAFRDPAANRAINLVFAALLVLSVVAAVLM